LLNYLDIISIKYQKLQNNPDTKMTKVEYALNYEVKFIRIHFSSQTSKKQQLLA